MTIGYHVTYGSYWAGDVLLPGNWGRQIRAFGVGLQAIPDSAMATILLWEVALESVRQVLTPHLPSRMACIFACETAEDAARFRNRYRKNAEILQIEFDDATPSHRGDFALISSVGPSGAYVDFMTDGARRYWTTAPTDLVEILAGGSVRVIGRLNAL